uniref:poly(A)-specific ribonuclease n=1 Tax=Fundulus heteroclitus TaxID=8078 RepID=A0A3Q2PL74_FUNHE
MTLWRLSCDGSRRLTSKRHRILSTSKLAEKPRYSNTEPRNSPQIAHALTHTCPLRGTDTEFPGVVARPIGEFRSNADYQYQLLRCNVDLLRIIQLGLTFMNEQGEYPPGTSTWQFNFKFNLTEDMYAQDSIELLTTSGIQFKKHEEEGIETLYFAELLMTSGVVLCDGVKWLSFHSGYDFGYLIKILSNANLPEEEVDFFEILRLYFPVIYDVKYLMKSCKNLKMFFEDHIDDAKYCGHLYGLSSGSIYVQNGTGNAYEEEANKQQS